jgi:hypothetical protein
LVQREWTGHHQDGESCSIDDFMIYSAKFNNMIVGRGNDKHGEFTIQGYMYPHNGQCVFKKSYPTYFVEYNGMLKPGQREMTGEWTMPQFGSRG